MQIKKVMRIGEDMLSIQIELEGEEYRYQFSVSFEKDVFDNSQKSELLQLIFKEKNSECNKIINEILANQNIKKTNIIH